MSNSDQSKVSPAKTYSEAVSASEGTRSEPSKTTKAVKTVVKKVKKQPKSPEEVPSEWDESNVSSKSEKPAKSKVISNKKTVPTSTKPVTPSLAIEQVVSTGTVKTNDPLPSTNPFKSKEKVSKLIDKDSISHLTFKKVDQVSKTESLSTPIAKNTIGKAKRVVKPPTAIDTVSEAAKTLLNGPTTFVQPIERSTQKLLDNYFVPQGRTVRSVSSTSSDHPRGSSVSDSAIPSNSSDLDIITALVEAKDLTGAPRGRHSAKISPSVSSASSGGEAKSGILPSSGEDKRRRPESSSSQIGVGTPKRSAALDHSGRIPEDFQLESESGIRQVPEYSEGPNVPEGERSRSDADSSSRSPHATAGGRAVSDPISRAPDGEPASAADVLPSERILLSLSANDSANTTLAPPELQSELLHVPAGVLPASAAGNKSSSPGGTVSPFSTDKKEGRRSSSEEQSQSSAQPKSKGTKLGPSSQLKSSPSGLKLSERQGETSTSPSAFYSSGNDKTQPYDSSSVSGARVHEKSERRGRESSSTPRGRTDSKKLTSDELTQMSQ
ncbi:hypothetical protein PGT21_025390 [Puccinia graminis f. sp. tritici]|uniref:Uncharacterized protein n=1 Tax=Puccinia graminis f. sp. tritici TaxID=56615 RepID=A0A5B0S1M5_PUCGR|nr:hypothetical protein PGT21_025390 [Puccinia graminis f. sp. tritici]KAA1131777.1 hypothetical protein PGTUg99_024759 [Puccinia graminis f. sp. tritici]